jgi:MGT family glycosyltransferase
MATILAYTSPAFGHLLPISALLSELAARGHIVHMRTFNAGVAVGRKQGFHADTIDPRIEAIELDDWKATNPSAALRLSVAAFGRRAAYEVADLGAAVAHINPDGLLVDVNCWGALSVADAGDTPWASFAPYTPPLRARGVPPFGLGLTPLSGVLGRVRDAAVRATVVRALERVMLPPVNAIRADVGLRQVTSMDDFLRRAPLMFLASAKPFQYQHSDWGDSVQMIGPCVLDDAPDAIPDWLASIERPVVLVTTSSEMQADADLVATAMTALADEPVHVVATLPTGQANAMIAPPNATVCEFVPHGILLDHAICAVTHGGMGATQKALARGIPVCVVPYGRDQFEVARRVEVAQCGTRLVAKKLSSARLRTKVKKAMTMTDGAKQVAAGFAATGGTSRGADLFEQRVLGVNED